MRPLILLAILLMAACAPTFQTTSGQDYLTARPEAQVDPEIRIAADVGEAQLAFPARIAIVQTDWRGILLPMGPGAEPLVTRAAQAGLGQIIPLNPILAERSNGTDIDAVRRLAAQQHADYVLILRSYGGRGPATIAAAFIDVRNGYPYASAQATARVGRPGTPDSQRRLMRAIQPDLEAMIDGLAARAGR